MDKVFYNESSAAKLGWEPGWFGCEYFDDELIVAIKKWQRKNGVTADGLVGPNTFRRLWTERESNISEYSPYEVLEDTCTRDNYIVHNGRFLPIDWHKVVLWDQEGGLKCDSGNYYDYSGKADRKPNHFVNHWDVCLSTKSMAKVVNKRGISIHFGIDSDGTIYQLLDTQHGAWHAGHWYGNKRGIGVEICNAYSMKYQDWYVRNVGKPRPVVAKGEAVVHGKPLKEHLGFYPEQIEALKALYKALHLGLGIPLEAPRDSDGYPILTVDPKVTGGEFTGFNHHFHYTKNKIDSGNLDIWTLLEEVRFELANQDIG